MSSVSVCSTSRGVERFGLWGLIRAVDDYKLGAGADLLKSGEASSAARCLRDKLYWHDYQHKKYSTDALAKGRPWILAAWFAPFADA